MASLIASLGLCAHAFAQGTVPQGATKGTAYAHTAASAVNVIEEASVALPASLTQGTPYFGKWKDIPRDLNGRVPVIVFLHGSSGLGLKAIEDWQRWLAGMGVASVAPDSFALPDRITYTSPIQKSVYERVHTLRSSEIPLTVAALRKATWADTTHLVLAGASEGAPAVARYGGDEFAARIIFAWSCEDNYFVESHGTVVVPEQPVLNVISSVDPYFSQSNPWLGNPEAKGNCAQALANSKLATIVLIPGAPHTLFNLPQARASTRAFLEDALGLHLQRAQ